MIQNYKPRERVTEIHYSVIFFYDENGGFSFDCTESGELLETVTPEARRNFEECLKHPERFKYFNEIRKEKRVYTSPARGKCHCGREVILYNEYMGACGCACGQWFNLFGQEILSPEAWED